MKTVFISGSPKKNFSASKYFSDIESFFVKGRKVKENLRNKGDHERILNSLIDADAVVFSVPLYVDGVPSHVLAFMEKMQAFCLDNNLKLKVYVISNGGFIEGKQSAAIMQVFKNFCSKSGLEWCGGIGIGGGVMLNVLKYIFFVETAIFILNVLINGFLDGIWFPAEVLEAYSGQLSVLLFFNFGVLLYSLLLGLKINKRLAFGEKYTRIMIPSFIFILIADVFFIVSSVFGGGIFKGWLSKKQ